VPVDVTLDPSLSASVEQPRRRFGALGYRDFRLLWSGLVVSNTGS